MSTIDWRVWRSMWRFQVSLFCFELWACLMTPWWGTEVGVNVQNFCGRAYWTGLRIRWGHGKGWRTPPGNDVYRGERWLAHWVTEESKESRTGLKKPRFKRKVGSKTIDNRIVWVNDGEAITPVMATSRVGAVVKVDGQYRWIEESAIDPEAIRSSKQGLVFVDEHGHFHGVIGDGIDVPMSVGASLPAKPTEG